MWWRVLLSLQTSSLRIKIQNDDLIRYQVPSKLIIFHDIYKKMADDIKLKFFIALFQDQLTLYETKSFSNNCLNGLKNKKTKWSGFHKMLFIELITGIRFRFGSKVPNPNGMWVQLTNDTFLKIHVWIHKWNFEVWSYTTGPLWIKILFTWYKSAM